MWPIYQLSYVCNDRNVARQTVSTHYVFPSDIELYPRWGWHTIHGDWDDQYHQDNQDDQENNDDQGDHDDQDDQYDRDDQGYHDDQDAD